MKLIEWLRAQKKSYWRKTIADRFVTVTFWIQERGDRSLLVGLGAGIIVVLFFKLLFCMVVIASVLGATTYLMAQDD